MEGGFNHGADCQVQVKRRGDWSQMWFWTYVVQTEIWSEYLKSGYVDPLAFIGLFAFFFLCVCVHTCVSVLCVSFAVISCISSISCSSVSLLWQERKRYKARVLFKLPHNRKSEDDITTRKNNEGGNSKSHNGWNYTGYILTGQNSADLFFSSVAISDNQSGNNGVALRSLTQTPPPPGHMWRCLQAELWCVWGSDTITVFPKKTQ